MIDEQKLKKIISNVLAVPIDSIHDGSTPDNIEKWDSLSHLNLVMAIEAEFDVESCYVFAVFSLVPSRAGAC